jgi:hypothetical protein
MIATSRLMRSFAAGSIAESVEDLWEPWMRHVDRVLELMGRRVNAARAASSSPGLKRCSHPFSRQRRVRGRQGNRRRPS